ncbi:hypothetical protein HY414_01665 [Candidatus Kaiserbacteria bacterium]|nr:hypothetical protein [Candidatus Kaiserbacteria bacterium]
MENTLIGAFPEAFRFLGDLLFKWVPATVIAVLNTSPSSPFANFEQPVTAWDVPTLLAQSAGASGYESLLKGWFVFSFITMVGSIPFLALVLYCWTRIFQIRRKEYRTFRAAQRTVVAQDIPRTQLRWNRVLDQTNSSSPESWRLAILEADIMLNELLDVQGYKGETMADKMKQVDRANFNAIDDAWEAHKIRNRVAHEGTAAELSHHEVRRVVALYERVFKEFKYIE